MKKKLYKSFNAKKQKASVYSVVVLIVLMIYVLSLFLLLGWGIINAFRTPNAFDENPIGFITSFDGFKNFATIFEHFHIQSINSGKQIYIENMFLNGFLYAFGSALANTIVPLLTAYVAARYNFKFSKVIYTIVVVVMILPIVGNLPAEINMAMTFGLYNKIWGQWIMKANFLGLYFLVFYAAARRIPAAYSEAAKIDGAGNFTIMVKICLPMLRNTFFTILLINFIAYWNDYQIPMIYLPDYPTISVGVYALGYQSTINELMYVPMRLAASVIVLIPVLVVFLIFHKKMLGNLDAGGIK